MSTKEAINPAVLVWARETSGLSFEEAAHKVGLTSGTRSTAAEKLEAMESGERAPSEAQLAKMAAAYHRPLLSFYMAQPPRPAERAEDFRTMRAPVAPQQAAWLDALVRDVRTRQSILRDMMEDDEDAGPVAFVGTLSISTPIAQAVNRTKAMLKIEDDRGFRRGMRQPEDLFAELRRRIETLGVFVILLGDLGSHHTAISPKVFRGFAVADKLAPMIVINDQDAKAAWSFTLVHELTHVFLGKTGISGLPATGEPHTPSARIERFCNDVAGELLLPDQAMAQLPQLVNAEAVIHEAEVLRRDWHVSKAMAAYRLWRERKTDAETYGEVVRVLGEQWQSQRDLEKEKNRNSEGGPNYYTVRRHRLGDALLRFVGHGLRADAVTHTTAARILGVRPGAVEPLLSSVMGLGNGAPPGEGHVVLYLLDANTLIRANADYYPIDRIPQFWDWLIECGNAGLVKIPNEIADEVTAGRDEVAGWLKGAEAKSALRLSERVDVALVRQVAAIGYAPDLDDTEMHTIGRDAFLVAYALVQTNRTVVTKEVSKPSKQRANRKVPDVCNACGVKWLNDFDFYRAANFRIR